MRDINYWNNIDRLRDAINSSDAIVIGAGAGLSTSAGFLYSGERFEMHFPDFIDKYGFMDMYSGGFYHFASLEEKWGYWSRYIMINRYENPPKDTYKNLLSLIRGKEYFVITTNVDHCFQKYGFDKERLFYTQGDYGLFQCSLPCHKKTYDNEKIVLEMVEKQNNRRIPTYLIPYCPICHRPMSMNLRADQTFVEDEGWHRAKNRYVDFLEKNDGKKILFLELGVGANTPGIIKYPFWRMTYNNENAIYACVNFDNERLPKEIEERGIIIDEDIDKVMRDLMNFI